VKIGTRSLSVLRRRPADAKRERHRKKSTADDLQKHGDSNAGTRMCE
jgi:hypothetical protein